MLSLDEIRRLRECSIKCLFLVQDTFNITGRGKVAQCVVISGGCPSKRNTEVSIIKQCLPLYKEFILGYETYCVSWAQTDNVIPGGGIGLLFKQDSVIEKGDIIMYEEKVDGIS